MDNIKKFNYKNQKSGSASQLSSAGLDMGKLPPQALDLEEAVLGAMMLEKSAVDDVIDIVKMESFYKEAHQNIFEAITKLFQNNEPIDILTVTQQLKKDDQLASVGGAYYISQLTNRVASTANVEYHARIVSQKHLLRELIRISNTTIKGAYDDTSDVFELLDFTETQLFGLAEGHLKRSSEKMHDLIYQAIQQIEEAGKKEGGVSGVETGFRDLDQITAGFQPADMVVIAARPGMGKTAFVLSMARNTAVEFGKGVAVFSLEMSAVQLINRLIASETGLSAEKLKKGNLEQHEWEQLNAKISKLSEAPLFIDDTPALSVFELRAKCRRLKNQHDIQMIVIDYLQLMTTGGNDGNREQEISTISRSIKSIAKELNVPIIALSQLSRAVETRGGEKRPMLSDLRESGAIEQDADMVMFIYRPAYYGIMEDEDGAPTDDLGELIVAKHRNGSLDTVKMKFIPHLAKFTNREEYGDAGLSALTPMNSDFDNPGSMIMGSKLNEEDDADAPF